MARLSARAGKYLVLGCAVENGCSGLQWPARRFFLVPRTARSKISPVSSNTMEGVPCRGCRNVVPKDKKACSFCGTLVKPLSMMSIVRLLVVIFAVYGVVWYLIGKYLYAY
jgi:hypothetical protein